MAKKKTEETFNGKITPKMLGLWIMAGLPDAHELRMELSTLQFYFQPELSDGLRVYGTQSLVVTEEMADEYFKREM